MRKEIYNYDIYPKTVIAGGVSTVNIKPLGSHVAFENGKDYKLIIIPMEESVEGTSDKHDEVVVKAENNIITFSYEFKREQEYAIRCPFFKNENETILLRIYALEKDLYERIPLKGDFHAHTTYSDGGEAPEIVVANYRQKGYDFTVISDHETYEGSVAAKKFYENVPIDFLIVNGEEVHSPDNHIHIINFGGEFSVNDMWRNDSETYYKEVREIADKLELPTDSKFINRFEYAACIWSCERIRKGKGLSIFAHPHWIVGPYHVANDMTRLLLKNKVFDAFELLGGQSQRENNMQLAVYFDALSGGYGDFPIVGSSDSHTSVMLSYEFSEVFNPNPYPFGFDRYKSIVFSKGNNKDDIISAVKDGYSVALDSSRGEPAAVYGNSRLTALALFLLSEYFPLHDELCYEEGRAMRAYATASEEDALKALEFYKGRTHKMKTKYFGSDK